MIYDLVVVLITFPVVKQIYSRSLVSYKHNDRLIKSYEDVLICITIELKLNMNLRTKTYLKNINKNKLAINLLDILLQVNVFVHLKKILSTPAYELQLVLLIIAIVLKYIIFVYIN